MILIRRYDDSDEGSDTLLPFRFTMFIILITTPSASNIVTLIRSASDSGGDSINGNGENSSGIVHITKSNMR